MIEVLKIIFLKDYNIMERTKGYGRIDRCMYDFNGELIRNSCDKKRKKQKYYEGLLAPYLTRQQFN
jgi:hypothetical protein